MRCSQQAHFWLALSSMSGAAQACCTQSPQCRPWLTWKPQQTAWRSKHPVPVRHAGSHRLAAVMQSFIASLNVPSGTQALADSSVLWSKARAICPGSPAFVSCEGLQPAPAGIAILGRRLRSDAVRCRRGAHRRAVRHSPHRQVPGRRRVVRRLRFIPCAGRRHGLSSCALRSRQHSQQGPARRSAEPSAQLVGVRRERGLSGPHLQG